jgi:hypothetical protein
MAAIALPSTGEYFACDIPDSGLAIQINPDVIARIGAAVMEGFKLVPRRGLEVGGVLLGSAEAGCIIVEDFTPVASEHQRGPSWVLSDKDRQSLGEAVSGANDAEKDTRVVGLYRSQTRTGFEPSEEDIALTEEYSGAGARVFLLVKPEGIGRSSALVAAGDGLQKRSDVFPFRGALRAPAAPRPSAPGPYSPAASSPPPSSPPPSSPPPSSPPPSTPVGRPIDHIPRLQTTRVLAGLAADGEQRPAKTPSVGRMLAQIAWTLGILFMAAVAGYALARWLTAPGAPETSSAAAGAMALHATWAGSSLRIEWDRNSTPVRRASGGVLWIDDGEHHRRLDLGTDDLTQGSIQYWPTSGDVAFRLAVFTPETTASESVRAVSVPIPARAQIAEPPPAHAASAAPPKLMRHGVESRRRSHASSR